MCSRLLLLVVSCVLGCRGPQPAQDPPDISPVMAALIESQPVETTLDRPDLENASEVWPQMIAHARRTLDIAQFYASEADAGARPTSKLKPVVDAVLRALERGVRVRFLADASFAGKYPETLEQLAAAGAQVRRIDFQALAGGVHHAKYFVVDGHASFLGSQNFDWRALAHIQELGVRLHSEELGAQLTDIFETDWALAGGAPSATRVRRSEPMRGLPTVDSGRVTLVASPRGWLPNEESWDLPRIVAMLDRAARAIALQVLTYRTVDRSGQPFPTLHDALRRASARGVPIRVLVSEWAMRDGARAGVEELARVAQVRVLTIPRWSGGDLPFARVAHAKYLVVDGDAWIGTSNWGGDYFTRARNVGVIFEQGTVPARVARFFDENWESPYALPIATP